MHFNVISKRHPTSLEDHHPFQLIYLTPIPEDSELQKGVLESFINALRTKYGHTVLRREDCHIINMAIGTEAKKPTLQVKIKYQDPYDLEQFLRELYPP